MRTRRWWDRALAALLALWFAVVTAEPAALHRCPTHGPNGTAAAAAHAAMTSGAMHHAGAAAVDAHAGGDSHPTEPGAGHQCSCLGECGAAGALTGDLPPRHPALWVPVAVLRATRAPRALAVPLAPADFVLPFANGPPTRA